MGNTKTPPNFDYTTTMSDQLRTVSLSNNSHPAAVAKLVYGYSTFPTNRKSSKNKWTHIHKFVNTGNHPSRDGGPTQMMRS